MGIPKFDEVSTIVVLHVYSKTCLKRALQKGKKLVYKTDYCLMQVKSIARGAFCNTFDLH